MFMYTVYDHISYDNILQGIVLSCGGFLLFKTFQSEIWRMPRCFLLCRWIALIPWNLLLFLVTGFFLKQVITPVTNVRKSKALLSPALPCLNSCLWKMLLLHVAFTILNCAITLVTIVKNSQELFTRALAYLSCHLSPPFLWELTRKSWCFKNLSYPYKISVAPNTVG